MKWVGITLLILIGLMILAYKGIKTLLSVMIVPITLGVVLYSLYYYIQFLSNLH